jgi:ubiquinone/menaquinone biosynthesis C-methylase UbiE
VCDAGCGPCGHVAALLASYGLRVVGIDISPVCVALASKEQPSLAFETMDMGKMRFPDGSLDGLVSYYSIHYQPKATLPDMLREFARVLRPGGRFLLVAKEGQGEGFIEDPMGSGEQVFWSDFSDTELQELLRNAGFTNTSCTVRDPLPDEIQVRRIFVTAEHNNCVSGG